MDMVVREFCLIAFYRPTLSWNFIDQRCHGLVLHFMDMVAIESYCIVWVWSLWNGIVLCGCGCHGMVLCGCGCRGMVLCGSEWYYIV